MAPANQPRLSLTGSEDGEAETETSRAAKPLWRKTNRPSGPPGPNLTEPPGADPHAGWCGRGERAIVPPIPLPYRLKIQMLLNNGGKPCLNSFGWCFLGCCWLLLRLLRSARRFQPPQVLRPNLTNLMASIRVGDSAHALKVAAAATAACTMLLPVSA